ncbi:MAG: hypothetical protein B7Z54_01035 [Sphingobacteriales bacterium 12-47-4]|nr:MAG: hypothetical protein B7Z54_01035 [Sphingobacteriales bacterium 12-47-4]
MVILFIGTFLLFLVYAGLILFLYYKWSAVPTYRNDQEPAADIRFSIIIPARNEETRIGFLLDALRKQDLDTSLWEVIVVDDDSTDHTNQVVGQYDQVKLIRLTGKDQNSYKKRALTEGIAQSRYEWILTTDADCVPGPHWLSTLSRFISDRNPQMVVAPVRMAHDFSLLQIFQALDFMTLQGITAGAVHGRFMHMCNGANLAYKKSAFQTVQGFSGIDHIASGDDMLLMQKIQQAFPGSAHYLLANEAVVATQPAYSWTEFIQQRIRWASKATYYQQASLFLVLLAVYLFNLAIPVLCIVSIFHLSALWMACALLGLKILIEFPFVASVARFYQDSALMKYFPILQPLHILYTLIAGWLGQFGHYSWKGRRVK